MLSPSQQRAEKAFLDFLGSKDQEMVIAGPAGSGKSYLTRHLKNAAIGYLKANLTIDKNAGFKMFYTATTNKAASVLSRMMGEPAQTVHSFLGLTVKNDYRTGNTKLVTTDKTVRHKKVLLFVDESSMINWELHDLIKQFVLGHESCKVVYIGDDYQLPPVKSNGSPVFLKVKRQVHLKEIQRQVAGSPIIKAGAVYREMLDKKFEGVWPVTPIDGTVVQQLSGSDFRAKIDSVFHTQPHPDDYKVLSYTNARVRAYNKHIRALYTKSGVFEKDEWVVTNNPIVDAGGRIVSPVDSVVQIREIEPDISVDKIVGYSIRLHNGHTVFMAADPKEVKDLLKQYAKSKDWSNFFRVKNGYADLRDVYSQTVHKSQGSSINEVFIDMNDIGTNKKFYEVLRLMYVAISRASQRVYLYGELPDRDWNLS